MRVLLFGATGMVGQGVLRESLRAPDVDLVQIIGRTSIEQRDPKLREVIQKDLYDFTAIEAQLQNFDACFFCLGVSAAALSEADYARITYDLTLAAAQTLARLNPQMTFIYVSGAGTDSTEHGRSMWARVKGRTENALRRLPFKAVLLFRPGIIQPLQGIRSKTRAYRVFYAVTKPILWLLRTGFPSSVLTTETVGLAMLNAVRNGAPTAVLEARDIRVMSRASRSRNRR
jgi:uncharacterized protein YbjT (DUF2867 family)